MTLSFGVNPSAHRFLLTDFRNSGLDVRKVENLRVTTDLIIKGNVCNCLEGNYALLGETRHCILVENLNGQTFCNFFSVFCKFLSRYHDTPDDAFTVFLPKKIIA